MTEELRCIARSQTPRYRGDRCGWYLTRPRTGERLEIVRVVPYSDVADPEHAIYQCGKCGALHEVRVEQNEAA